jgi:hypothetical protein
MDSAYKTCLQSVSGGWYDEGRMNGRGSSMLWSEVRGLFPNQYVMVQELKTHALGNYIHVDEVAVIKPIPDANKAWKEFFACKDGRFVYHTSKEEIVMEVKLKPVVRRIAPYEG